MFRARKAIAHAAPQFLTLIKWKTSVVCHMPASPGARWEGSSVTVTRLAELLNIPCGAVGIILLQAQTWILGWNNYDFSHCVLASWFCSPLPWIRILLLVWWKLSSCISIPSEVPVLSSPSVPREKCLKKTFYVGVFIRCTVIIHLRIKQSSSSHFHVSLLYVSLPLYHRSPLFPRQVPILFLEGILTPFGEMRVPVLWVLESCFFVFSLCIGKWWYLFHLKHANVLMSCNCCPRFLGIVSSLFGLFITIQYCRLFIHAMFSIPINACRLW